MLKATLTISKTFRDDKVKKYVV